jgi:hypothetical protein
MNRLTPNLIVTMALFVCLSAVAHTETQAATCPEISSHNLVYADEVLAAFGDGIFGTPLQNTGATLEPAVQMAMRKLGAGNPLWSPMHPKWNEIALKVREDIASLFRAAASAMNDDFSPVARCAYARTMSPDDLKALAGYFKSAAGKRDLQFSSELRKTIAAAMFNAMSVPRSSPSPNNSADAVPTASLIQARLDLIQSSVDIGGFQSTGEAIKRKGGDVSGYAVMGYVYADIARRSGEPMDELSSKYVGDLENFRMFTRSSLVQRHGEGMMAITNLPAFKSAQSLYISVLSRGGTKSEIEWKRIYQERVADVSSN